MLIDAGAGGYPSDLKLRVSTYFSKNTDRLFLDALGRVGVIVRTDELPPPRLEEIGLAISGELSDLDRPVVIAVSEVGKGIRSIRELYLQTLETVKVKRERGRPASFYLVLTRSPQIRRTRSGGNLTSCLKPC